MWKYSLASSALTSAVIWYAYSTREQYYPTVVFLVTSKICIACLGNQAIVCTLLMGRLAKAIFLGTLREVEVELLYDNARYAITETCLALTIFREELTVRVFCLFTGLLFAKVFHWLVGSRVDYLEHAERVSAISHMRFISLIAWLAFVDACALAGCAYVCLKHGPSVLLLFGFEFAILGLTLLASTARYGLYGIETRYFDGNWPSKASYVFFVDFLAEIARFAVYVVFFGILFANYGIPLHIVRELWLSYVSLRRRFSHYQRYRALTADMDERFADAEPEDLQRDSVCIICRETMERGKKLPCNHVFHLSCLRLWLQQQQSCPTCRAEIPIDYHVGRQREARDARAERAAAAEQQPPPPAQPAPARPNPVEEQPATPVAAPNPAALDPAATSTSLAADILAAFVATSREPLGRPQLPPGAKIYRVQRPLGVRVLSEKRRDAPSHRTIAYGSHVLALSEDNQFLRLGDGWLIDDDSLASFTLDDDDRMRYQDQSDSPILMALESIQSQLADLRDELRALRAQHEQLRAIGHFPVEETKTSAEPSQADDG